jgi:hypothetical protein
MRFMPLLCKHTLGRFFRFENHIASLAKWVYAIQEQELTIVSNNTRQGYAQAPQTGGSLVLRACFT